MVCPFHFYGFYDICNQYRLFSDGDTGKIYLARDVVDYIKSKRMVINRHD